MPLSKIGSNPSSAMTSEENTSKRTQDSEPAALRSQDPAARSNAVVQYLEGTIPKMRRTTAKERNYVL